MAGAVEKVEPEAADKVEPDAVENVDAEHLLSTGFGSPSLISRLGGTLPGLVGAAVEVDNKIDDLPLLFFSDCVPPGFTRSLRFTLLSPTSGAYSKSNAEYRLHVDTGGFSIAICGLDDLPGATL